MEIKDKKIIEYFFYKGEKFIMYEDGTTNTTLQRYKDHKQYKQNRVNKGWD